MKKQLPKAKSKAAITRASNDRFLAEMTLNVFRAGFSWKVIDSKWDGFEEAFHKFDIGWNANLHEELLEQLACDTRIVRNLQKIKTVRDNARFIEEACEEHGSFGKFIAQWPEDDIVGLWFYLKKHGSRLGGASGSIMLRGMGKDTFILSRDVVSCLRNHRIIDTDTPTSKRDLLAIQATFNQWREETGLKLCELSRIAAYSIES